MKKWFLPLIIISMISLRIGNLITDFHEMHNSDSITESFFDHGIDDDQMYIESDDVNIRTFSNFISIKTAVPNPLEHHLHIWKPPVNS